MKILHVWQLKIKKKTKNILNKPKHFIYPREFHFKMFMYTRCDGDVCIGYTTFSYSTTKEEMPKGYNMFGIQSH